MISFRSAFRLLGSLFVVILLSACAGLSAPSQLDAPPREALEQFVLDGRFSLYYESRTYSGRLNWVHRATTSELLLSSPFGQGLAEIVTDAHGARLVGGDGRHHQAPDVETLTREVLGFPLPLSQMADWVRGRVASEPSEIDQLDLLGRLVSSRRNSWRIDYDYADQDPGAAPVRISVKRGDSFELRVFVDAWQSLSSEGKNP